MIAYTDLSRRAFTTVARNVRVTTVTDGWEWNMRPGEVTKLLVHQQHGGVVTVTDRDENGALVLRAKLTASGVAPTGPAVFALAGRGLFEDA